MTAHFPNFITEACGAINPDGILYTLGITSTSTLGAAALSVIELTNITGTLTGGYLGNRYSKKTLLAAVYLARALVTFGFISFPITPLSVLIFSALMGMLWLAILPLTSGLVAYIFGLRYIGTLYGIVSSRTSLAALSESGWAGECLTSMAAKHWCDELALVSGYSAHWCICRSAKNPL